MNRLSRDLTASQEKGSLVSGFIRGLVDARLPFLALALTGLSLLEVLYGAVRSGPLNSRSEYAALLGVLAALAAGFSIVSWRRAAGGPAPLPEDQAGGVALSPRWLRWGFLWAGTLVLFEALVLGPWGRFLEPFFVRALAFFLLVWACSALLNRTDPAWSYAGKLGVTALALGAAHQVAANLPLISTYPLSLGWSEASRYYYASLFLSRSIYGFDVPPSVLHPSRYLLQSIPFLFAPEILWVHRAWQVLLWLGMPALAAWLLSRRLTFTSKALGLTFSGWAFLFLLQGPILYHLLVALALVLAGFDSRRPVRSLIVVLLASVWVGISRVNWLPVPGFLAATLFFLERDPGNESPARYLAWPAVWIGLGGATALASQAAYVLLSGQAVEQFSSSFTSDLFWYRLLPNPTFPPGILPGAAILSAPLALLLYRTRSAWQKVHILRRLGIAGMVGVLLAGGLLVSLKIGGGSNLHNLDAYMALAVVVGAYLYAGGIALRGGSVSDRPRLDWRLGALAVATPILFTLAAGRPIQRQDPEAGEAIVAQLQAEIDALGSNPQVLLTGERHLLTFGQLHGLKLIPDFERVFLMEMAMSDNRPYLEALYSGLRRHEYDLIVSDPLVIQFQGRTRAFGEENDVWVRKVSIPMLCFYEPLVTYSQAAVQILVPRETPGEACEFMDP